MDIDGKLQTLDFVNCYFSHPNWTTSAATAGEQCVNQIFTDMWPSIDTCAHTDEGSTLLLANKAKVDALSPSLEYTPWVTVNSVHSTEAETNLGNAVCNTYNVC